MKNMKILTALLVLMVVSSISLADVNINTADAKTIQAELKGVGLQKAQAIIEYRESHGAFHNVDDLVKVKGIGAKIIELNRENITVETSASAN